VTEGLPGRLVRRELRVHRVRRALPGSLVRAGRRVRRVRKARWGRLAPPDRLG
jgi:hypothetical protein